MRHSPYWSGSRRDPKGTERIFSTSQFGLPSQEPRILPTTGKIVRGKLAMLWGRRHPRYSTFHGGRRISSQLSRRTEATSVRRTFFCGSRSLRPARLRKGPDLHVGRIPQASRRPRIRSLRRSRPPPGKHRSPGCWTQSDLLLSTTTGSERDRSNLRGIRTAEGTQRRPSARRSSIRRISAEASNRTLASRSATRSRKALSSSSQSRRTSKPASEKPQRSGRDSCRADPKSRGKEGVALQIGPPTSNRL